MPYAAQNTDTEERKGTYACNLRTLYIRKESLSGAARRITGNDKRKQGGLSAGPSRTGPLILLKALQQKPYQSAGRENARTDRAVLF